MKALKKTQYLIQIQGLFTKTKALIYTNRIKLNLNKKRRLNFYQILKIKGKKSIACNPSKSCNKEAHNNVGDVMVRCIRFPLVEEDSSTNPDRHCHHEMG